MDVVATVAQRLGVQPEQAQAVLGAVLGAARAQVPAAETQKLDAGIPELGAWMEAANLASAAAATTPPRAEGLLGGLLQAAGSGFGNEILGAVVGKEAQQAASAAALLDTLGLETKHAAMVAPVVLDLLRTRLGGEWADRVIGAAPLLQAWLGGAAPAAGSSPIGDLLSSMMGGDRKD